MLFVSIFTAISVVLSNQLSTLNGLSISMTNNGCSAYDCKRSCLSSADVSETPGDNGFRFEIEGLKDDKYEPDGVYKG